jgi:hypothetical protein
MYELFVFPTEIEHQGTRQLIRHNFPLAELCDVFDPNDPEDIFMDFYYDIERGLFLRWAMETTEGGNRVVHYCYNLSLALTETPMPRWLVSVLRVHPNLLDSLNH